MRRLTALSAAMMVVVALGWLLVIDRTADTTFAAVIEKVHQVKSVTCRCKRTFAGTVESVSKLYIREDAMRNEVPGHGVLIFDRIKKKAIALDERSKVAIFPSLVPGAPIPNPLEELRNLKQESAERIGEETLQGRQLEVYRLRDVDLVENSYGENDADIKLWVDPQTQLPVKLIIFAPKSQIDTYVEFSDFHWNEELDPSLFSLEIPAGYTVEKEPLVQPEPAEKMLEEGENVRTGVLPANSAEKMGKDSGKPARTQVLSAKSAENAKVANLVSGYAPIIKNALFVAKPSKGGAATAPIDNCLTNETPPRYFQRGEFGNERIGFGFQYIGRGQVDQTSTVDVYLIYVKIGDQPEENIPVIYSGGDKVVVDRPEIHISINQDE